MAISEAMVSSAPTIEASTSTKIVNAVTTRTASENGVRSSLSTRLVNQRIPKPASKEVSVVSWVLPWKGWFRRQDAKPGPTAEGALEALHEADVMILASVLKSILDVLPPQPRALVREALRKLVAEQMDQVPTPVAPEYAQIYRDRISLIAQIFLSDRPSNASGREGESRPTQGIEGRTPRTL